MPVEPVTVEVGGEEFVITPLGAERGLEVFAELLSVVGPSAASALDGVQSLESVDTAALVRGIREACQGPLSRNVLHFWKIFAERTKYTKNGKAVPLASVQEALFQGRVQDMVTLLGHHLRVNYSGFLGAATSWMAMLAAKAATK